MFEFSFQRVKDFMQLKLSDLFYTYSKNMAVWLVCFKESEKMIGIRRHEIILVYDVQLCKNYETVDTLLNPFPEPTSSEQLL